MTKRWVQDHANDYYRKSAKKDDYRSRASYKLIQINERHNVIREGDIVVDLGAAPGGWSQVAQELVGEDGIVVSLDIDYMPPIDGVHFIQGDITAKGTRERLRDLIHSLSQYQVSVVVSDMSPNISGNANRDQATSYYLANIALQFARANLKNGGNFICKIFQGTDLEDFLSDAKENFKSVKRYSPPASRKSSSEVYVICKSRR